MESNQHSSICVNFHDLGVNIYWKKIWSCWFVSNPHTWHHIPGTILGPAGCCQLLLLFLLTPTDKIWFIEVVCRLRTALPVRLTWVCASPLLSFKDGNRFGFQDIVLFFKYRTVYRVQEHCNLGCNMLLSETFRIDILGVFVDVH
jgi:hypothetical protein